MAEMNPEVLYAQDFIDESGWTSLEPDHAGRYPYDGAPDSEIIRGPAGTPWVARRDELRFERSPQRGLTPVEGDGVGGPE